MKRRNKWSTRLSENKKWEWLNRRGEGCALLLIFILYFSFVAWYSSLIPLGKGVDEEAHFLYVEDIRDKGALPILEVPHKGHYESHQPPLFYIISLPIAYIFGDNWRIWGRWFSSLWIAVGGFFCYLAGKRLFGKNRVLYLSSTAFVLLLPGNIAIASGFTNDSLAQALFTLAIFFLLEKKEKDWLWAGLATAGAILAKLNCLVLLPTGLLGLLLSLKNEDWQKVTKKALYFLLPPILFTSWWFIRNKLLYGDFLGWQIFQEAFATSPQPSYFLERGVSWGGYWSLVLLTCFRSFWTPLLKVRFLFWGYYAVLGLFLFLSLVGLIKWLKEDEEKRVSIYVLLISLLLLFLLFIRFNLHFFEAQGRYLYPALGSFSLLFIGSLGKLHHRLPMLHILYLILLVSLSSSILY